MIHFLSLIYAACLLLLQTHPDAAVWAVRGGLRLLLLTLMLLQLTLILLLLTLLLVLLTLMLLEGRAGEE